MSGIRGKKDIFTQILSKLVLEKNLDSLSTLYHATLLTKGVDEKIRKRYRNAVLTIIEEALESLNVGEKIDINPESIIEEILHPSRDYANRELFSVIFFQKDINPYIEEFLFLDEKIVIYDEKTIKKEALKGEKIAIPDFIMATPSTRVAIELTRVTGILASNLDKKILKILKRRENLRKLKIDHWILVVQIGVPMSNTYDIMRFFSELFENFLPTFFNPRRVYGVIKQGIIEIENEAKQGKSTHSKRIYKKILENIKKYVEYLCSEIPIKANTVVLPFYITYRKELNKKVMVEYVKRNQQKFMEFLKEIFLKEPS